MMKIIVLWVVSLVVVGVVASGLGMAQSSEQYPRMLSGNEIGFRLEGVSGPKGQPVGTIMVHVNGQWVEAGYSAPLDRNK